MNTNQRKNFYLDQEFVNFLETIDTTELICKIKKFRKININSLSDNELAEEINSTLSFNGAMVLKVMTTVYKEGSYLFRVRLLDGFDVPNNNIRLISDFWNPPADKVIYGRLNKPGESLLYTSPIDPHVSIDEMNIKNGCYYALIRYKLKRDINCSCIGYDYDYSKIGIKSERAIVNNEIINNFLIDEFSREVGIGTEYLYRSSEIISKWYFDLPPSYQDAWCYPSVKNKKSWNLCFRPDKAKSVLNLCGAVICEKTEEKKIKCLCITSGFDSNGNAMYFPIGSNEQMKYFPEIIRSKGK